MPRVPKVLGQVPPTTAPPAPPPEPKPSAAERTIPMFADQPPQVLGASVPQGAPPTVVTGSGAAPHPPPNPHPVSTHVAPESGVVTVTWGEEMYQPRQWHSYRVGPFTISAPILKGETVSQAVMRLTQELAEVARHARVVKRQEYQKALADIDQMVASSRPTSAAAKPG